MAYISLIAFVAAMRPNVSIVDDGQKNRWCHDCCRISEIKCSIIALLISHEQSNVIDCWTGATQMCSSTPGILQPQPAP